MRAKILNANAKSGGVITGSRLRFARNVYVALRENLFLIGRSTEFRHDLAGKLVLRRCTSTTRVDVCRAVNIHRMNAPLATRDLLVRD